MWDVSSVMCYVMWYGLCVMCVQGSLCYVLCNCNARIFHLFSSSFIMVQLQLAAVILQLAASCHLLCASFNLFLIINFHFQNSVRVVVRVGVWGTLR